MSSITFNTNGGAKGSTGGGSGNASVTTFTITATVATVVLGSVNLVGLLANKIISVDRAGLLYNVVSGAPGIRECNINALAGTITVNAAEPFFIGEVVTFKQLTSSTDTLAVITITAPSDGTVITDAALNGINTAKIVYVERAGMLYNIVTGLPDVRQCAINNSANTITVNAAEPFFTGEVVTIKKIV